MVDQRLMHVMPGYRRCKDPTNYDNRGQVV